MTLTLIDAISSTNSFLDLLVTFPTLLFSLAIAEGVLFLGAPILVLLVAAPCFFHFLIIIDYTELARSSNWIKIFLYSLPASYSFTILFRSWRDCSFSCGTVMVWTLEGCLLAACLRQNDCSQHWHHIVSSLTCHDSWMIWMHFKSQNVNKISCNIQMDRWFLYVTTAFAKCIFSSFSLWYFRLKIYLNYICWKIWCILIFLYSASGKYSYLHVNITFFIITQKRFIVGWWNMYRFSTIYIYEKRHTNWLFFSQINEQFTNIIIKRRNQKSLSTEYIFITNNQLYNLSA